MNESPAPSSIRFGDAPTASSAKRARTAWMPLALAVFASVGVGVSFQDGAELRAASGSSLNDEDGDGLVDTQEEILGTSIYDDDTDQDGFADLEEIARASDPLDFDSIPGNQQLSIGITARAENGVVTMVAPIFAPAGTFGRLDLELGVVFSDGTRFELTPQLYLPVLRGAVYPTKSASSRLVLLEMPFPQSLIQGLGSLSLYGAVEDPETSMSATADVVNLVDFSGVIVMASTAPPSYGLQPGVIYAPIVPDEDIPASWVSGEICWQQASPVGMVGSSTAYEVTKGLCTSSDTYCSPGDCKSKVGNNLTLTDPSTLIGG